MVKDYNGASYANVTEMARAYDMDPTLVINRLKRGWDLEKALNKPARHTHSSGARLSALHKAITYVIKTGEPKQVRSGTNNKVFLWLRGEELYAAVRGDTNFTEMVCADVEAFPIELIVYDATQIVERRTSDDS